MDDAERLVAVEALDLPLGRLAHVAAQVHERAAEDELAEIQAHDVPRVFDELEQDRRLAARRRPAADLARQPVTDQLADDVPDRRPGQPAHACDLGPADRAVLVQGAQHQRDVVRPRLLVGRLGRKGHVVRSAPLRPGTRWGALGRISHENFVQSLDKHLLHCQVSGRSLPARRGPWPHVRLGRALENRLSTPEDAYRGSAVARRATGCRLSAKSVGCGKLRSIGRVKAPIPCQAPASRR
jgi:hypothetical protein